MATQSAIGLSIMSVTAHTIFSIQFPVSLVVQVLAGELQPHRWPSRARSRRKYSHNWHSEQGPGACGGSRSKHPNSTSVLFVRTGVMVVHSLCERCQHLVDVSVSYTYYEQGSVCIQCSDPGDFSCCFLFSFFFQSLCLLLWYLWPKTCQKCWIIFKNYNTEVNCNWGPYTIP